MTILSFDTATKKMSVALGNDQSKIIDVFQSNGDKQHGEVALPIIQEIMQINDVSISDINKIVVGIGPGSYTGLRIGITIAKTWAELMGIPLEKMSSLAMMLPLEQIEKDTLYIPMIDARRQTVYSGIYQLHNRKYQSIINDRHISWEEYQQVIENHLKEATDIQQIILIGDSFVEDYVHLLQNTCKQIQGSISVKPLDRYPQAASAFHSAFEELIEEVAQPNLLVPHYAHLTLAEQEWKKAQQEGNFSEQHNEYIEITH